MTICRIRGWYREILKLRRRVSWKSERGRARWNLSRRFLPRKSADFERHSRDTHNAQCEHRVCLFGETGTERESKSRAEAGKLQSRRRITAGAAKRIIDASVLMASPAVYYERFSRCDANAGLESTPREKALRIYEPWIEHARYDRGFPAMTGR